jgi:hypothetical protein
VVTGWRVVRQSAVVAVGEIDRAAGFGKPQLDAATFAPCVQGGELGAGESALVLADHEGIPASPAARMSLATVLRLTMMPIFRRSSACTRGAP